jgi:ankyrin repeat protein
LDLIGQGPSFSERLSNWRVGNFGPGSSDSDSRSLRDSWLISAMRLEAGYAIPRLLESGAHPDARDPDSPQLTAVTLAAEANDLETLDLLLAAGGNARLRTVNAGGQEVTPLRRALRYDAAEAISRLLKAGATVSGNDPTGWTTMHIAAYEGATRSFPILMRAGGDINERTPADRHQTPLMTAVQHSGLEAVSALVRLGADLNAIDSEGKSACDWAMFFRRDDSIRALVCRGHQVPSTATEAPNT